MSYIERDVTLNIDGKTAKFDDMVYIFKGDRDIQLNIKIIDTKMKFSRTNISGNVLTPLPKGCYARVGLVKPKGGDPVIRDRVAIEDDKVKFLIDSTVCDELDEVGIHKIQIQIYALDDDASPRWTLPSAAELEVCKPDVDFDGITPIVGLAKAGLSMTISEGDTTIVDFNEDGTYNKTTWSSGDVISTEKLNKIENVLDHNVNKTREHDTQIKDIAKDLLLEDGKLYLKKSDGTKLGTGVILPISGSGGSVTWENLTGKPSTFTPSSHSHSKSDITDFPTIPTKTSELNNDSGFLTSHQDLSNYVQKETGKGLSTNDLTTTLKQNYDSAYAHSQSTHAPSDAQKNSDITKEEIEAKLTGEISSHSHPGGSSVTDSEFKKVIETTFGEDCYAFTVTQDKDGNPLQLKEGIICVTVSQPKNTETQISFGVGFLDWTYSYNGRCSIYNVALMKNYEFYRLHVYFKIINNKVLAINLGTARTGTVAPSFNNFDSANSTAKVDMSSFRTLQNNYIDKIVIGLDMANTGLISGDSILEVWSI